MQRIEIEGGIQRAIEYTVLSEVPLASVLRHLERAPRLTSPILPRSAILFGQGTNETGSMELYMLLELPPATRMISFRGRDGGTREHRLAIPWTYFHFTCSTVDASRNENWMIGMHRAYWSRARVTDIRTASFLVPKLPNIYEDGRICFGSTAPSAALPIGERLDQIVNEFYSSEFNRDLHIRYPGGYTRLADWAAATARDANCWNSWTDWRESARAEQLLDEALAPAQPIVIEGTIPQYTSGMSFGAADAWLRTLAPNDRIRLRTELGNMAEDQPELLVATPVTTTAEDAED